MRTSNLVFALGALLVSSFTTAHSNGHHAGLAVRAAEADFSSADSSSSLMKRTNGLNHCSGSNLIMAFHSGGSCSCKTSCGKQETECKGPVGGGGTGACTSQGCTILCNAGLSLVNGKCVAPCPNNEERVNGQCVCVPGCSRHPSTKACNPTCDANEKLVNGKCVCSSPFATDYKGNCVKPPTCTEFEFWNGKDCVCRPTCGKNKKTNQCEPQCQDNASYIGGICKCFAGFVAKGDSCVPQCGEGSEWCEDTHKCICKAGFTTILGKCAPIPTCPKNEEYNLVSKICECIPSCSRNPTNKQCLPTPPPPPPSCAAHEVYFPLTKKCECVLGYYKPSGSNVCTSIIPSCPKNEVYNFLKHECECIPSCFRHGSTNECTPIGPSQAAAKPVVQKKIAARNAPLWSSKHHTREQDSLFCPDGLSACPISANLGGYECVDTKEELENCGGCTANGDGRDCTALPNVSGVGCNAGKCVVFSCNESHRLSANGACVPALFNQS